MKAFFWSNTTRHFQINTSPSDSIPPPSTVNGAWWPAPSDSRATCSIRRAPSQTMRRLIVTACTHLGGVNKGDCSDLYVLFTHLCWSRAEARRGSGAASLSAGFSNSVALGTGGGRNKRRRRREQTPCLAGWEDQSLIRSRGGWSIHILCWSKSIDTSVTKKSDKSKGADSTHLLK